MRTVRKAAAKRDFIALFAPRAFLDVWEPWMQGGISASRDTLGSGWQEAFLTAPIWRFWLGAEICGATVAGAFMPSLDGVGRYYPLTLFAYADPGIAIPPPDLDAQDEWFARRRTICCPRSTRKCRSSRPRARSTSLPPPAADAPSARRRATWSRVADGTVAAHATDSTLPDLFARPARGQFRKHLFGGELLVDDRRR